MKNILLRQMVAIVFLSLLSGSLMTAQVALSPTFILIDDQTNIGNITLRNPGDAAVEVNVGFEFSYPGYDPGGQMVQVKDDSLAALRFGLGDQIRAFPRSFIIQPGQTQTVRLQIRPLHDKPDGVYWTRVVVNSNAASPDVETTSIAEGIGARINLEFSQTFPVFYGKGKLSTGIQVMDVKTSLKNDKLAVIARLNPVGNAPYNGSVTATLRNRSGEVVAEQQTIVVAYFEALRRVELTLPEGGLPAGNYVLEMNYETRRRDIPANDLVQAPPVRHTAEVTID